MSRELPGYARAQAEWENRLPPEDGPSECANCNGKGELPDPTDEDVDYVQCEVCEGFGELTHDGEPHDSSESERAAEHADHLRDCARDDFATGERL